MKLGQLAHSAALYLELNLMARDKEPDITILEDGFVKSCGPVKYLAQWWVRPMICIWFETDAYRPAVKKRGTKVKAQGNEPACTPEAASVKGNCFHKTVLWETAFCPTLPPSGPSEKANRQGGWPLLPKTRLHNKYSDRETASATAPTMNDQLRKDLRKHSDILWIENPMPEDQVARFSDLHDTPPDLLAFWREFGSGLMFESEWLLRPFEESPSIEFITERERAKGLPRQLTVFHTGIFISGFDSNGFEVFDVGSYRFVGRYFLLDDWYIETIRDEFAERYGFSRL